MPLPIPEPTAAPVNFAEAIDYFRSKVRIPTRRWNDLWRDQHAAGFMVAGAMRDELLADLQAAIAKAMESGTTLEEFRRDFDEIVARHGWSYRGGRNWRTRVIFETNLRTAYSAGRWSQAQRLKATRPFGRYVAVMDERTRELHRHWHGTVLHIDHPWWGTHIPPNGWGCRCRFVTLSARDLRRYGFTVTEPAPEVQRTTRQVRGPDGAKIPVEVPAGIDPGFDYNPGLGAFGRARQKVEMERNSGFERLWAPGQVVPDPPDLEAVDPIGRVLPPLAAPTEDGLRRRLREALGDDERILSDPLGVPVAVTQAIVDHMLENERRLDGRDRYFPLIPELVEKPQEIWIGFVRDTGGRVHVRRRHVRLIREGKDRLIGLVAEVVRGDWVGLTFFRGSRSAINQVRQGRLVWRQGD